MNRTMQSMHVDRERIVGGRFGSINQGRKIRRVVMGEGKDC
jgi:hypothetical protein